MQEIIDRTSGEERPPVPKMDFVLNKLETKGKNVKVVNWDEVRRTNGVSSIVNHNDKQQTKRKPESMQLALDKLVPMVADVMYYGEFLIEGNGNPDIQAMYDKVCARITVVGVKYNKRQSVHIMYDLLAENGLVMGGMKTHAIQLEATTYGWEKELNELLAKIDSEAWQYACTNIDPQMDMLADLGQSKKAEKTDLERAIEYDE